METITGTVDKIIYISQDAQSDFKIFSLRRKNHTYQTITGCFSEIIPGVEIEVHGEFVNHPKYGKSFKAKAYTFQFNRTSQESVALYLQSIANFIGPIRARSLASHFGEELEHVIENDADRLLEVEGIGEKIAQNLVKAWRDHREEKSVRIFLHTLGLSENKIKRIMTAFGIEAEEKIKANPYLLTTVDFGFSTCDHIARKVGLTPNDPVRFRYFILYVLKESTQSGHLYLSNEQILKSFNAFNAETTYKFKESELILSDIVPHMETLLNEGYVVREDFCYYSLESYFYESESARLINLMLTTPATVDMSSIDVEDFIKIYEEEQKIETGITDFSLSDKQREAAKSFITEKMMIITGGPGTGKTRLQNLIVEMMINNGIAFELLTPTGIAAKKLGNTAKYEAYTIHRRLGYKGSAWDYGAYNKYETDVVIVDEASMVDQEVFYHLISALNSSTKLILVGDNDQLPSVGPGRVLNEFIQSKVIKTIFLDTIFRQAEKSDIIKQAKKIKEGDTDLSLLKPEKTADIWFIRETNIEPIEQFIVNLAASFKEKIKRDKKDITFQIITPRNSGPLSVATLNVLLQSTLNPRVEGEKEITLNSCVIRKGDRVLIRKNNYDLDIFNGDIGKVSNIDGYHIIVDIEGYEGSKEVRIPLEIAEETIKLGYSLTAHKSQGMEYDVVIIPIVKQHGKLILQRNLLYTAITRAKKKVILIGHGSAIVMAIENDRIAKRNTLFAQRINGWKNGIGTTLRQLYNQPSDCQNAETLKQLLLLEELASVVRPTTKISCPRNSTPDGEEDPVSPPQSSKLSSPLKTSLDRLLKDLDVQANESRLS